MHCCFLLCRHSQLCYQMQDNSLYCSRSTHQDKTMLAMRMWLFNIPFKWPFLYQTNCNDTSHEQKNNICFTARTCITVSLLWGLSQVREEPLLAQWTIHNGLTTFPHGENRVVIEYCWASLFLPILTWSCDKSMDYYSQTMNPCGF